MTKTKTREDIMKEKDADQVRGMAHGLKGYIQVHKEIYNEDMTEEICQYLKE